MKYIIGTRGSKLALAQADCVRKKLAKAYPDHEFELQVIRTTGDRILDKPLHELGSKGVFVKEIEENILSHKADIGVHSMKDMPSYPAAGLTFAKSWKREDPRDVLILREKSSLEELPEGAVIGTGSRRREFQLKRLRPDIKVAAIRGNVDTRLQKMEAEKLDGIILAAAGIKRLGMEDRITQYLEEEEMIPAPAQGVLALEIRQEDMDLLDMLNRFQDEETVLAADAEREFLREIGGDCHVPAGAFCRKQEDGCFCLRVMFGNETGSRQAYAAVCGDDSRALAKKAAACIRRQMAGKVFLVGAGPGDPGLITVKGLMAIQKADCIIYDRLSSPELLESAKPGCEMIYVGKENHRHTMEQEAIQGLLVQKSMEHETVVRLKGGDVCVFGRGGEEGLWLREHGVSFEMIPGITSAIAGPAYAGIPVTHRGLASGFHVVTAHGQKNGRPEIDFEAMAKGKETCIFLMGLKKAEEIANGLMEAGMPGSTKAAVISCATTPRQQTCVADLEHIAQEVRRFQLTSPAIIVVGPVVSLREELGFFEQEALFGKRYLIPRIGEKTTRLRELLASKGAAADEVQVGELVYAGKKFAADQLHSVDWLVFTSKNGVKAFFKGLVESRVDVRALGRCKIAVIGKKTKEELQRHGLYADLVPEEFHSGGLAKELRKHLSGTECVWYLKAENADSHLRDALEGVCRFKEIAVYENREVTPDLEKLEDLENYDGILFTCASSAERFLDVVKGQWGKWKGVYSIGPKTTAELKKCGVKNVRQAGWAAYEGMVEALVADLKINC